MKPATKGTIFRLLYIQALVGAMIAVSAGVVLSFSTRLWPGILLVGLGTIITFLATELRDAETECLIACLGEEVNKGIKGIIKDKIEKLEEEREAER